MINRISILYRLRASVEIVTRGRPPGSASPLGSQSTKPPCDERWSTSCHSRTIEMAFALKKITAVGSTQPLQ